LVESGQNYCNEKKVAFWPMLYIRCTNMMHVVHFNMIMHIIFLSLFC